MDYKYYMYQLNRRRAIPEWAVLEQECYDLLKQMQGFYGGNQSDVARDANVHMRSLTKQMRDIAVNNGLLEAI